jgi:hypothetical protein
MRLLRLNPSMPANPLCRRYEAPIQANLSSRMNFGYSLDLSRMNGLDYTRTATHEVIIGLLLRNARRARCPSDFW